MCVLLILTPDSSLYFNSFQILPPYPLFPSLLNFFPFKKNNLPTSICDTHIFMGVGHYHLFTKSVIFKENGLSFP